MRKSTLKEKLVDNYQQILIGLLLAVILFQISFLLPDKQTVKKTASIKISGDQTLTANDLANQREHWSEKMDEIGTDAAYEEFKETAKNLHFGTQHTLAHIIGELLYAKSGLDGLSVCDDSFAFGCYHSYFSQALLANGIEIIKDLDAECIKEYGPLGSGCQHGIGHGLSEYFGPSKLVPALEACKDTTQAGELAGCVSGVFMEYNIPILITEATASSAPRTMENDDPYAPCPSMPKQFQPSCYYELPQWWGQGPFPHDTLKQGQLCEHVPNPDQLEKCYLGLGKIIAPNSNFNVEIILSACRHMPTERGRIMCQAGASWSFDAQPEYQHLAKGLCVNLDESASGICREEARSLDPANQ
jgi:hypothetical protein